MIFGHYLGYYGRAFLLAGLPLAITLAILAVWFLVEDD